MPNARGLFRRTLPTSPYGIKQKPPRAASRWCDREDEPGWPGHKFRHRVNTLGQVTPSSSMCTPVHELNKPIYYHPIYKTPPVLKFTSQWDHQEGAREHSDIRKRREARREAADASSRRSRYDLNSEEAGLYERFVELLAGMERTEMEDVGEDIIKDAQERKLLLHFGGAEVGTAKRKGLAGGEKANDKARKEVYSWVKRAPRLDHMGDFGKLPNKYAYGSQQPQLGAGQLGLNTLFH